MVGGGQFAAAGLGIAAGKKSGRREGVIAALGMTGVAAAAMVLFRFSTVAWIQAID